MRLGRREFREQIRTFSDFDVMLAAIAVLESEPSSDPAEERDRRATLAEVRRRGLGRRMRQLARGMSSGELPWPAIFGTPLSPDPGTSAQRKGSRG